MIPKMLLNGVIILVSAAFAANYTLQFFVPGYQSDPAIVAVFGAVVGAALALSKREPPAGGGSGDSTEGGAS